MSADARHIAFQTKARLVAEDTDDVNDIYVRDRLANTVTRVGPGSVPSMSGDGRYVAYATGVSFYDSTSEIRIYDVRAQTIRVLSLNLPPPPEGTCPSACPYAVYAPDISYDGRYIAFIATSIRGYSEGLIHRGDVFLYDGLQQTATKVSVKTGGTEVTGTETCDSVHVIEIDLFCGSGHGARASVSDDGRYVGYVSTYGFALEDTNLVRDVYVHDVSTRITTLLSRAAAGGAANGPSSGTLSMSGDGRYVAFHSTASNIVAYTPFDPATPQVFVHDRNSGRSFMVSRTAGGNAADEGGSSPVISGTGRFLTFTSRATNLAGAEAAPGEVPTGFSHIYIAELTVDDSGGLEALRFSKASIASDATPNAAQEPVNGFSGWVTDLSDDGRFVAFLSSASTLVPDDENDATDVFLHDRSTFFLRTVRPAASNDTLDMREPAVSADGRYVAFTSTNTTLVAGDSNGVGDIFVRDRLTNSVVRVSVSTAGGQTNGASSTPAISAEGRWVVFASVATNLVAGDGNQVSDIFVHDRDTDQDGRFDEAGRVRTTRVNLGAGGAQANGPSTSPVISGDGQVIAYASLANNLIANDSNGVSDIFVYDARAGLTTRVSVNTMSYGTQATGPSEQPAISNSGRFVAFASLASDLIDTSAVGEGGAFKLMDGQPHRPDTNGVMDVFLHDRFGAFGCTGCPPRTPQPGTSGKTSRISAVGLLEANGPSYSPSVSDAVQNGFFIEPWVAFTTDSTNLTSFPDANGVSDVILRTATMSFALKATRPDNNGASTSPAISADAKLVAFVSAATNLVFRDTNGQEDIFLLRNPLAATSVSELSGSVLTRVSVAEFGESDARSYDPSISADGQVVVFTTDSTALVDPASAALATTRNRSGLISAGLTTTSGDPGNSTEIIYRSKTPEITHVAPDRGSVSGGEQVTVLGRNLDYQWLQDKSLQLGEWRASALTLRTADAFSAVTGAATRTGLFDALIFDTTQQFVSKLPDGFTYESSPTTPSCDGGYSLSQQQIGVTSGAQQVTVQVTTGSGCDWSPLSDSNSPWLTVLNGGGGGLTSVVHDGSGSFTIAIEPNTSGDPRSARVFVHTLVLTVTQSAGQTPPEICNGVDDDGDGSIDEGCPGDEICNNGIDDDEDGQVDECPILACTYVVSPSSTTAPVAGGSGAVTIIASNSACAWTVTNPVAWLTITGSGVGSTTAGFLVAPNNGPSRSTTLTIAGHPVTIVQDGRAAATLDFDGDGSLDLLWHHQTDGRMAGWLMQDTQQRRGLELSPGQVTDTTWKLVGAGDLDADGDADLVWQNADGRIAAWLMNGLVQQQGTLFSIPQLPDTQWKIRSVGDVDNDGRADLFWQHEGDGRIAVWLMDGLLVREGIFLTPGVVPDLQWKVVGTADFNQDGRRDLVWHHQGDGRIAVWLMNGTTLLRGLETSPGQVADTGWKIRAIGDLNADGQPDLIWQHTVNGALAVWHMRGLTLLDATLLSPATVADTNWHIVGPR